MSTIAEDDQLLSSQNMVLNLNDLPRKKDDFSRSDNIGSEDNSHSRQSLKTIGAQEKRR